MNERADATPETQAAGATSPTSDGGTQARTADEAAGDGAFVRLRLGIAYDGTDFNGWSRQPGLRTVQGVLETALATLFRRTSVVPRLTVAGRTDAGVHALGQVAHLDLPADAFASVTRPRRGHSPDGATAEAVLKRRVTGILGADADVVVTELVRAPVGFDARFSALWRRYEYRVSDASARRDPLERRRTVTVPRVLDAAAMDAAAGRLVGLHDFAAFCKPRAGATTIRTLQSYRWVRDGDGLLVASLQADAFCHSMVRALVGACVAVGEGRLDPDDAEQLLHAARRTSAFMVMPAKGLVLTEVGYPDEAEMELRAAQTRARRELHVDGVIG